MDPVQFRIDWEVLMELLVTIIVLAFFIERALSIVFENRLFVNSRLDDNGSKEILSFLVSLAAVKWVGFDALAILFKLDAPRWPGYVITAAIVAGGSKASIKLFQDLMDLKSSARRQKDAIKKINREAQLAQVRGGAEVQRVA
ncbi:MAG: hypothetical protein ACK5ZA_06120 [Betaproteobacteria bacterium]|jgi:hypothetical protein